MRRAVETTGLILLASLTWIAPSAAQTSDWTVQLEGKVGVFKATRDIGKILGSEVQTQIKTVLRAAPVFGVGFLLRGPSPSFTLRGSAAYMSTDARGQYGGCSVVSGPGCAHLDIPATSVQGTVDILLHRDGGGATLKYFIAGLGIRSYSFDEVECRGIEDPILFNVCSPMTEFLADQKGLLGRLGVGIQRSVGPMGLTVEVVDQVGSFEGAGAQGEGGIQNDFVVSVGATFPGR